MVAVDIVDLVVCWLVPVVQTVDQLHASRSFLERLCDDWDLVFSADKSDLDGLALHDRLGSLRETPANRLEKGLR